MASHNSTRGRRATHPDDVIAFALENGLPDQSTINSNPIRRQLKPKSQMVYDRDFQIWKAYLKKYPGSDLRDMQTMKHFAEVVWRGTRGRLSTETGKATPRSIRIKLRRFYNTWEREHHTVIPEEVKYSIAPFIQGELKDKVGAQDIKRPMTFLTIKNYVHMQEFLWFSDYHDYVHDGFRVDNSNLLNTHCFTSARLQEVCQATYEDIRFMVSWKDGEPEFKLGFKREHCKGMDEKQPEHPMAERMEGPDGLPPPLYAQPMLHWLVNIISSGALGSDHSIEKVLELQPPEGEDFWSIPWAENMKSQPVFPNWSVDGPLGKTRDPTAWGKHASLWAQRAGFVNGLGLHAPRREILIKTNDSGAAVGQVMKFAGQRNPKVLLHHYLDDMSTIDGAAIFLGTNPRKDLTQDFRSATMKRNAQLPQTLPSEVKAALENQQEYVRLTGELECLAPRKGSAAEVKRKQLYDERRKIVLMALKHYQMSQVQAYPIKPKEHEQRDWRKDYFDRTRHLQPERDRLATTLSARVHLRSPEGISALRDMIALRRNECRVAYQRVLQPLHGCCPVPSCLREMAKIPAKKRWEHVFACYETYYKAQFGYSQFCFLCTGWETSEADWEAHCQNHIDKQDIPFRCDPVIFRTAVACAGYCPCCLSDESTPAAKRMHQHKRRCNWLRHVHCCISKYVEEQNNPSWMPCPHPRCPVVSHGDADLWHHLADVHSISKPSAGKRSQDVEDESTHLAKTCRNASPPAGPASVYPFPEAAILISAEAAENALGAGTPSTSSRSGDSMLDYDPLSVHTPRSSTSPWTDGLKMPCPSWGPGKGEQEWEHSSPLGAPLPGPHDGHGQHATGVLDSGTDLADAPETWAHESSMRYAVSEAEDTAICVDAVAQRIAPSSAALPRIPVSAIDPALRDDPERLEQADTMAARHAQDDDSTGRSKPLSTVVDAPAPRHHSGEDADDVGLRTDKYLVDCLLGKWGGSYFVKWAQDGCYSWEPRGNILDDELVATFEKSYTGFGPGVEVLRTRTRKGKTEYLLRCMGRPQHEDWWVPERHMSPELIMKHKPAKRKAQRRKWPR